MTGFRRKQTLLTAFGFHLKPTYPVQNKMLAMWTYWRPCVLSRSSDPHWGPSQSAPQTERSIPSWHLSMGPSCCTQTDVSPGSWCKYVPLIDHISFLSIRKCLCLCQGINLFNFLCDTNDEKMNVSTCFPKHKFISNHCWKQTTDLPVISKNFYCTLKITQIQVSISKAWCFPPWLPHHMHGFEISICNIIPL